MEETEGEVDGVLCALFTIVQWSGRWYVGVLISIAIMASWVHKQLSIKWQSTQQMNANFVHVTVKKTFWK